MVARWPGRAVELVPGSSFEQQKRYRSAGEDAGNGEGSR
jgi:hypothetical protein